MSAKVLKLEPRPIPPAVDFAARMYGGDWTEGIVPDIEAHPSGWYFAHEGQWVVEAAGLYYRVSCDGEHICDVSQVAGPFFFVHFPSDDAVYCRLDMPEGVIVETAAFNVRDEEWPEWEIYGDPS